MNKPVFILNGPNLNLLGTRQPEVYGSTTLSDIERICADTAKSLGLATDFRQSNSEDELVSWIQEARDAAAAMSFGGASGHLYAYVGGHIGRLTGNGPADCGSPLVQHS